MVRAARAGGDHLSTTPGVYLVRLTQGGRSEMARGVVLR